MGQVYVMEETKLCQFVLAPCYSGSGFSIYFLSQAVSKLSALARITGYMDADKLKICPLVWMFHSRHLNSKINRINERALRIAYRDYDSSFNTLLEKYDSVNIHVTAKSYD